MQLALTPEEANFDVLSIPNYWWFSFLDFHLLFLSSRSLIISRIKLIIKQIMQSPEGSKRFAIIG
jgi:hypothetical protein